MSRAALVWRSALYCAAAVGLLTMVAGVVRHYRVPSFSPLVMEEVGLFHLALAGLLWLRRARPSLGPAAAASLFGTLALLAGQWQAMSVAALLQHAWTPFQGIKMVSLFIALVGPEIPWLIVANVLLLTGSAVAQYFTFDAAVRGRLGLDEPWATLMYGGLALLLFYYRYRRHEAARLVARAEQQSAGLQRLARVFMAVRDLNNSPLQTLQLGVELLDRGHPDLAPKIERMKRSLERLRELDGILSRYENKVDWRGSPESFDARRILADELPAD